MIALGFGLGIGRSLTAGLGVAISEHIATLTNTLADSTLPIGAIPGLLERVNALDARLETIGIASADPDVATAIAAVLVDLADAIEAIDLHRVLAVVLPALEAAMTQLEQAAANPNPNPQPSGQWFANSTDIFANGTDWFADGTRGGGGGTSAPALTLTGPATISEGNPSASAPALTLSGPVTITEGNPSASTPALTLSGPATLTEGNPAAASPALTLSGPATLTEGNPTSPAVTLSGPATLTEGN